MGRLPLLLLHLAVLQFVKCFEVRAGYRCEVSIMLAHKLVWYGQSEAAEDGVVTVDTRALMSK
jgi:hypothetical protein